MAEIAAFLRFTAFPSPGWSSSEAVQKWRAIFECRRSDAGTAEGRLDGGCAAKKKKNQSGCLLKNLPRMSFD